MNTQKHVFEFTGMVTKKGKDQEPVVYEETFYVVAETSEQALQRVTKDNPKVTGLPTPARARLVANTGSRYQGPLARCLADWIALLSC
jgi:hypothetical protein